MDRRTDRQTNKPWRKHYLLGRGKNEHLNINLIETTLKAETIVGLRLKLIFDNLGWECVTMTCAAARHQVAIEMFWYHFWGVGMLFKFAQSFGCIQSLQSPAMRDKTKSRGIQITPCTCKLIACTAILEVYSDELISVFITSSHI